MDRTSVPLVATAVQGVVAGGSSGQGRYRRSRVPRYAALALSTIVGLVLLSCAPSPSRSAPAAAPASAPASSAPGAAAAPASGAGAAPAPAADAPAPGPLMTVRVATAGSFTSVLLGEEKGYFKEEGLTIETIVFDTSPKMLPALAQGQVDAATGGIAAGLYNAMAQGIPIRIVLDVWTATPGNQAGGLYVRKDLVDDGLIRDLRDLKGRRVGITSTGHATELVLDKGMRQVGLSVDDVEPVELSYPDMTLGLANKSIDAAITIEPFGVQSIGLGVGSRFKPWPELYPNDEVAMFLFSQDFAEKQTEAGKRFAKAYVRALRDWHEAGSTGRDRPWINDMIIKHTQLKDRPTVEQQPLTSVNPDGYPSREAIGAAQDWFFERGYVARKVDLNLIIDTQFVDYAVAQLGPYRAPAR